MDKSESESSEGVTLLPPFLGPSDVDQRPPLPRKPPVVGPADASGDDDPETVTRDLSDRDDGCQINPHGVEQVHL